MDLPALDFRSPASGGNRHMDLPHRSSVFRLLVVPPHGPVGGVTPTYPVAFL